MFSKKTPPVGAQPGTLAINKDSPAPKIRVIDYDAKEITEHEIKEPSELRSFAEKKSVSWIDVQGLGDEKVLREVADIFSLHPLTLADVTNIPSRPKTEYYDDYIIFITSMVDLDNDGKLNAEQFSVIWGSNFVLTFQENYGDILDPVRNRIRLNQGMLRKSGTDYLAYALIDTIIDGYYPVLEVLGDRLEELENAVLEYPKQENLQDIYCTKRDLLSLRRSIWPQRESLHSLLRNDHKLIKKAVHVYLQDTYDHCIQIIDVTETFRELCAGLTDLYLSGVSNKMNEIMKTLTIISTIFMPLSFLAGIYGMNFDYLPELHYKWAYPLFWLIVVSVSMGMLFWFYKRGWLSFSKDK